MISAPFQDTRPSRSKQQVYTVHFLHLQRKLRCTDGASAQRKKEKNQLVLSPLPFNKAIANRGVKVTALNKR